MESSTLHHYLEQRCTGRQNAVSSRALEALFQVRGARVRQCVNELRCAGRPICSDDAGYFFAANAAEVTATIRQLQSRIGKIAKAKNGLVRAMARYDTDQLHLTENHEPPTTKGDHHA